MLEVNNFMAVILLFPYLFGWLGVLRVGIDCVRMRSEKGYMIGEVVLSIIF